MAESKSHFRLKNGEKEVEYEGPVAEVITRFDKAYELMGTPSTTDNVENSNFIAFYQEAAQMRRDFVDRAWESIKLFIVIAIPVLAAGVSVTVAIYNSSNFASLPAITRASYTLLLSSFPMLGILITWLTKTNFRRECTRMYEQIVILDKISEKLGLYKKRNQERKKFSKDEYYVPTAWLDEKRDNGKEFVESMLKQNNKFFGMMNRIFWFYAILTMVFLFGMILLLDFA